jgi:ribosomal peptide maturation radical SAM protein 1
MKVTLINMPFAALDVPSIALTQLKSLLDQNFAEQVTTRVLYLNHDFAHYLGLPIYTYVARSLEANMCGLGDWFFKQAAFPDEIDNVDEYLQRFFPGRDEKFEMMKRLLLTKRQGLDGFFSRLIAKYRLDADDLVGFTSMFAQNVASFAMASKLKSYQPNVVTVMGGANCETPMGREIARHVGSVDFVFSGPALKSFPLFVQHLLSGEEQECHRIRGVLSKKNYLLAVAEGSDAIGEELDIDTPIELDYAPFLAELSKNFPTTEVTPTLLFETSRGCWWGERAHCTFCGLNGVTMTYRAMGADKALELLNNLFDYAPQCTRFESVDNIMPKEYLTEVFPRLASPPNTTIFYEVKADLKEEEMEILSRAGVKEIQPGIESLATSTLKLMKKGTTAIQNISFLKNCLTYGIQPVWNLLIGFPGETETVYRKYLADIPLLTHLPPPSGVYPVRFDRYSPYFVQAEHYGLNLRPSYFYELIYPFSPEALANLAYYFTDHNYTAPYLTTMIEWSDRLKQAVDQWCARWATDGKQPAPRLEFQQRGDRTIIYDSRNGDATEHDVGETGIQLLKFLSSRKRLSEIESHLGGLSHPSAGDELSALRAKQLLFEEDNSYLSLVMPGAIASAPL